MDDKVSDHITRPTRFHEFSSKGSLDGLLAFYTRQTNPYSCSATSVQIVLNAIRARFAGADPFSSITCEELLSKVRAAHWKERVGMGGFRGRHGLSVGELGIVAEAALRIFSLPYEQFRIVRIHPGMLNRQAKKDRLFSVLSKMENDPNIYILAHFTQGVYVGDWFGGHISPVGGFDSESGEVLVLDVDEDIEGPYWTPFDIFFEGLTGEMKNMGTIGGGYISFRTPMTKKYE